MSNPLVTLGVPVYRGQEILPVTLECLRAQTYTNLDVLISVDAADEASLEAARPFLGDPRFRAHMQGSRLGWAGNTDWTIQHRRGDFYIYQQHDDQVSPTYVADLVEAAGRWPQAAICFSEMQLSGLQNRLVRAPSTMGDPIARALTHMKRLDASMLRGLIRGKALDRTDGLLMNDFEGFGSEYRFMAQLALAGEFRFVKGPTYYKRLHGENLHLKWYDWPEERKRLAWAALAASMLEVIVPAGASLPERSGLFDTILDRFLVRRGPLSRIRDRSRSLYKRNRSVAATLLLAALDRLRSGGTFDAWIFPHTRPMLCRIDNAEQREAVARETIRRLRAGGRFDPTILQSDWDRLQAAAIRRSAERGP